MKYQVERVEHAVIFRPLEPRMNAAITPELKSELTVLAHSSTEGVIIDLSAVETLDSSVLSALLLLRRLLEPAGRSLVIVAPSAALQSVFSLSKLDEIFTIMTTIEDALKYMQQQAVLLAKKAEEEEDDEEWEEDGDWDEDQDDDDDWDEDWEEDGDWDEDWEDDDDWDEDWDEDDWDEEDEDDEDEDED